MLRNLQKLFKKTLRLSYKRARRDPAKKPDVELYNSKKKNLESLENFAKKGFVDLYYFDESGFNLTPNLPYVWSVIGKTISIPARMSRNLNVLGFLNINNSKLFASTTYDKVDTDIVIEVFNLFVETLTKKTIVVLDNAAIHTSKKFKNQIKRWEQKGLFLFYLPPYSPQLNPIEQLWKFMKYYWIDLEAYTSTEKLKDYVEKVIVGYGNEYEIKFY